jgi:bifunctional non-homologous end joining protein LigD
MSSQGWPPLIRPMLAVAGDLPDEVGWVYEFKWDGVRALAYTDGAGGLRLMSRNDIDVTTCYPELAAVGDKLGRRRAVLDGEIVTLGLGGAASFSRLQRRMHVRNPSAALLAAVPVQYVVFDAPYLGRALTAQPWRDRRAALDELGLAGAPVVVAPYFDRRPDTVMAAAREQGLEGVVSKRVDAAYQPGRRSPAWRKTALIRTTEVVMVGYKPGAGRREGTVGSLVLGAYDDAGQLVYVGGVGTGFTAAMLDELSRLLRPLHRTSSPLATAIPAADARGVRWVEPRLVGDVVYRTVTPDGRLRHPSWRGLRPDRRPDEVRLPERVRS